MIFQEPVYVIDGLRTPFLKEKKSFGPCTASDLAVSCSQALLNKTQINAKVIDEVITGCAIPNEDEANIAKIIALRLGCKEDLPAYTVMRNCASGMQSVASACDSILTKRAECVLAVGTEAMSRSPFFYNEKARQSLIELSKGSKGLLKALKLRPNFLKPILALKHGLTDPLFNMMMGQTAQEIAYHFQITRQQMDEFALQSHQKAAQAWEDQIFKEVHPLIDTQKGQVLTQDNGIRAGNTIEKLAKLRGVFEKFGDITQGNSSQVTDGAGALLLASEHFVNKYQITPLGKITAQSWTGCQPQMMGLGPVKAMANIISEKNISCEDIDFFEINEAFAAQVLGCVACFNDPEKGRTLGKINQEFGAIEAEKLNIHGGAVALGHPIGASGVRIILRSLYQLKEHKKQKALASLCIGGGQGGATLLEAV